MSHYRAFKFAFPGMRNEFLEKVPSLLRDALGQALAAKEIYTLYHPHPVSFHDLYHAMEKVLVSLPAVAVCEHVGKPGEGHDSSSIQRIWGNRQRRPSCPLEV